jgi:hypothetical protein
LAVVKPVKADVGARRPEFDYSDRIEQIELASVPEGGVHRFFCKLRGSRRLVRCRFADRSFQVRAPLNFFVPHLSVLILAEA